MGSELVEALANLLEESDSNSEKSSPSSPSPEDSIGCSHYNRGCQIVAPCCGKIFTCRLCHDEITTMLPTPIDDIHSIDRFSIQEIICLKCKKKQKVQQYCENCNLCFGNYYCEKCRLFDNDTTKGQRHCEKCGFCRIYGDKEYFHCDGCNQCLGIDLKDNHECIDIKDEVCPICDEEIFITTKDICKVKCGHWIHNECMLGMLNNNNYKCPICSKSMVDLTLYNSFLDGQIQNTPMPDEYKDKKVYILCHECNMESQVNYHFYGLKCANCETYNTREIKK